MSRSTLSICKPGMNGRAVLSGTAMSQQSAGITCSINMHPRNPDEMQSFQNDVYLPTCTRIREVRARFRAWFKTVI